jgi:hypothetical protein
MSGPQFVHIETYARSVSSLRLERQVARAEQNKVVDRKLTVEEICGEAARLPGHCPHVEDAKEPILLDGISPDQVPALLEKRVAAANTEIRAKKKTMPKGTRATGPRAIRSDTHVLLTIVASHPIPWRDEQSDTALFEDPENQALLEKWQSLNIKWAKQKARQLGFEVVSVVRHDDEAHPHLHFLCIPTNERIDARRCHPGYIAKEALKPEEGEGDKPAKKRRDKAYSDAMRAFQDDYYETVSLDAGLLRTGPKRARLPRAVYYTDKALGRARGLASVRADQLAGENGQAQQEIDRTKGILDATEKETNDAIMFVSYLERERDALQNDVENKTIETLSLSTSLKEGEALLIEQRLETARLQKAKDERRELEAQNDRIRAERTRDAEKLRLLGLDLTEEKRKFAEDKKRRKDKLVKRARALKTAQSELDSLTEGVVAYAEGKLRYNPANEAEPFTVPFQPDGSEKDLKARLAPVKPRLVRIIRGLDNAMAARAAQMHNAISKAVAGWSTGILESVEEPGVDGRPTFSISETPKGKNLHRVIEPFRELVALVISALPDRGLIASVTSALPRFQSRLTQTERDEALLLQENLKRLNEQNSKGR